MSEDTDVKVGEVEGEEKPAYYPCVYCGEYCSGILLKESKDKTGSSDELEEVHDPFINMFGLEEPIHTRCLKDAVVGIKFMIKDYPKLKNIVMLMHPGNNKVKKYTWSELGMIDDIGDNSE